MLPCYGCSGSPWVNIVSLLLFFGIFSVFFSPLNLSVIVVLFLWFLSSFPFLSSLLSSSLLFYPGLPCLLFRSSPLLYIFFTLVQFSLLLSYYSVFSSFPQPPLTSPLFPHLLLPPHSSLLLLCLSSLLSIPSFLSLYILQQCNHLKNFKSWHF